MIKGLGNPDQITYANTYLFLRKNLSYFISKA